VKIRRSYRLGLALVSAMAFTGCLGGATEAVPVSGVYELQTINNSRLPFAFSNGVVVVKETFTINANGTFTDVTTRQDGTVVSDQGVYTQFGGTINFGDQTAGLVFQGIVTGTTLTTQIGGFTSVFIRTGPAIQ
jgi:hypothetical protein